MRTEDSPGMARARAGLGRPRRRAPLRGLVPPLPMGRTLRRAQPSMDRGLQLQRVRRASAPRGC
eukprot:3887355-Alexandrium_andersonii.AAC.1